MQKNLKPGSKDSDELEVLSILVKEYELDHYPVPKPNPLEAIKFRLEQMGMSEAELSAILVYILIEKCTRFLLKSVPLSNDKNRPFVGVTKGHKSCWTWRRIIRSYCFI